MVSLDKAVIARYSPAGKHFEVYVDPVVAQKVKKNETVSSQDLLAADEIYKDAKKAEKAGEGNLQEVFGTLDTFEVAKQIIKKGELQLTTEQRRQMVEEKKKAIIALIARESFNPQTKTPHPPQRIENAIEQAKVPINPTERAEDQVEKVVQAIRPILPISIEKLKIEVIVPPMYTGKVYGILKNYNMQKEDWLGDGTLKAVVQIPAGVESDFYNEINNVTKGETQFNRLGDIK